MRTAPMALGCVMQYELLLELVVGYAVALPWGHVGFSVWFYYTRVCFTCSQKSEDERLCTCGVCMSTPAGLIPWGFMARVGDL